jgi:hypothetical protein
MNELVKRISTTEYIFSDTGTTPAQSATSLAGEGNIFSDTNVEGNPLSFLVLSD